MPRITTLHPLFAAAISGRDLTQELDDAISAIVRDAFERHSVLDRATPFAGTSERRHMVRTTVAGA